MRLAAIIAVFAILLVFAVSIFVGLTSSYHNAPRFEQVRTPSTVNAVSYDFLSSRPFEAGMMTIAASTGATNGGVFVYDIDHRRVLGLLSNGWPVMLVGEPLQVVCCQPAPVVAPINFGDRWLNLLARISRGRIKAPASESGQTYWTLNLANNTAKRLGDIRGPPFSFFASPDLRYCFTSRIGLRPAPEIYLLDLQRSSMRALDAAVWPCDWWDNSRIFADTTNSDFVLFDVQKGSISRLFTRGQLATFMEEMKISAPSGPHAFAIWNGHENDFYLTDTHQKWLAQESFLIKVERPGGKLKLISPHFKFEWSDHLDPTGRFYLYSGREPGKASDGIFLRDLETGTDRVLVRPTTNEYFSIPRFYRDSVIYVRSNALWQISLDRTNNVRLFPPIEAEEPKSH